MYPLDPDCQNSCVQIFNQNARYPQYFIKLCIGLVNTNNFYPKYIIPVVLILLNH